MFSCRMFFFSFFFKSLIYKEQQQEKNKTISFLVEKYSGERLFIVAKVCVLSSKPVPKHGVKVLPTYNVYSRCRVEFKKKGEIYNELGQ